MKKLLLLLLVILGSCSIETDSIEDFKKAINSPILSIEHFEYKGHDYILFDSGNGHWAGGGVVHDPDCNKCKENYDTRRDTK